MDSIISVEEQRCKKQISGVIEIEWWCGTCGSCCIVLLLYCRGASHLPTPAEFTPPLRRLLRLLVQLHSSDAHLLRAVFVAAVVLSLLLSCLSASCFASLALSVALPRCQSVRVSACVDFPTISQAMYKCAPCFLPAASAIVRPPSATATVSARYSTLLSESVDRSALFPLRVPSQSGVCAAGRAFSPFPAPVGYVLSLPQLRPASLPVAVRASLPPVAVMRAVPSYLDRPQGTWAEQCVAADLSFFEPLHIHQSPIIAVEAVRRMWWTSTGSSISASSATQPTQPTDDIPRLAK